MRRLAPFLVRHADDRHLLHGRVAQQHALDLDRRDVLAAADDHVLASGRESRRSRPDARPPRRRCGTSRRASPARSLQDRCSSRPSPRCRARRSRRASAPSCGTSLPSSSTTRSSPDVISSTPWRALMTGALVGCELRVLGPRLADRDERRRLGQAVDLRDLPAELAFDPLDRRGGRRRAGGEHAHAAGRVAGAAPRARWRCRSAPSARRRAC